MGFIILMRRLYVFTYVCSFSHLYISNFVVVIILSKNESLLRFGRNVFFSLVHFSASYNYTTLTLTRN